MKSVSQHISNQAKSIAVIGAGVAGLHAARLLQQQGHRVCVFEKSRGRGGRCATRRRDYGSFDHGAQFFTARDENFRASLSDWVENDIVSPWSGRFARQQADGTLAPLKNQEWFVAKPGMSGLGRALAEGLDIHTQTRPERILNDDDGWRLIDEQGKDLNTFDLVIIAAPAPQAAVLLESAAPTFSAKAQSVNYAPCWSVLLGSTDENAQLDWPYDGCQFTDGPFSWVARNRSKPGREGNESWVLHASPGWSQEHVDEDKTVVINRLSQAFSSLTDSEMKPFDQRDAHRWLYALVQNSLTDGALWDAELQIGACGDWCQGSRVEDAWLSGQTLAKMIQQST